MRRSLRFFLEDFSKVNKERQHVKYCFVLGAGASVESGIRAAKDLAIQWLEELREKEFSTIAPEEWVTEQTLVRNLGAEFEGINSQNLGYFYNVIYRQRFSHDPTEGYEFLEHEIENAFPSVGYSILGYILTMTRHDVVITTNFDDLVTNALRLYYDSNPLVLGHEALASIYRNTLNRPIVLKVHRDLLLEPINNPDSELLGSWGQVLREVFRSYKPIFIGYAGNDIDMMNFLLRLENGFLSQGCYWLTYEPKLLIGEINSKVDDRLKEFLHKQNGILVPIDGFDRVMSRLGKVVGYGQRLESMISSHESKVARYKKQLSEFRMRIIEGNEILRDIKNASDPGNDIVIDCYMSACECISNEERIPVYSKAIEQLPDRHELYVFRGIAKKMTGHYDEAAGDFSRALELSPGEPASLINMAGILIDHLGKPDEGIVMLENALRERPNSHVGHYYLGCAYHDLGQYNKATSYFSSAISLGGQHAIYYFNYACSLSLSGDISLALEQISNGYALAPTDMIELLEAEDQDLQAVFDSDIFKNWIQETKALQS